MKIALDYDKTYDRDPQAWNTFVQNMQREGHVVYCVTMRYPTGHEKDPSGHEAAPVQRALGHLMDGIHFTGRQGKRKFMSDRGINIDVWIDDMPETIIMDFDQ